jgi:hypothetical protein
MWELMTIHRRFLMKETIIAIVVNMLISYAITFGMFRSQNEIMLWGKNGLFIDLIPTIFLMIFCMTAIMTPATRSRISKGTAPSAPWHRREYFILRFLPVVSVVRALVMGIVGLLVLLPTSCGLLIILKQFPISFSEMLMLKTGFGALIGFLFTPLIVMGAMSDKGGVSVQAI